MTSPFSDNADKRIVREQWDTPLLRHLHSEYGVRYRYCGLPGVDLIDVRLWQDMIEEVVAFEPPDESPDGRAAITSLRHNLRKFGVSGRAYWGSFEEVVLLRKDYEGTEYLQNKVITLYNLDFCDEISSPVATQEEGKKVWRFEAIRQVLRDQHDCYRRDKAPRHFILMLTVRNQMDAAKLRRFLAPSRLQGETKTHYDACMGLNPIPTAGSLVGTHSWALKTLIFNCLSAYFGNPNLSALFFPQILYQGTRKRIRVRGRTRYLPSPMLHWLVLCRFSDEEAPGPDFWPAAFLTNPSVSVGTRRGCLEWSPQDGEHHNGNGAPASVGWFRRHGGDISAGLSRSSTNAGHTP